MRKDKKMLVPTIVFMVAVLFLQIGGMIERGYFAITIEPFLVLGYLGYMRYVSIKSAERKEMRKIEREEVERKLKKACQAA